MPNKIDEILEGLPDNVKVIALKWAITKTLEFDADFYKILVHEVNCLKSISGGEY